MEALIKNNLELLKKKFPDVAKHFDDQVALSKRKNSLTLPPLKNIQTLFVNQPSPTLLDALKEHAHINIVLIFDTPSKLTLFLKEPTTKNLLKHTRFFCYWIEQKAPDLSSLPESFFRGKFYIFSKDPEFKALIRYRAQVLSGFQSEMLTLGQTFFRNYYFNLLKLPSSLLASQFYGKFKDVPAIICGAGPSLAKNLSLLETLKDHAIIIAGGSAMNAINTNGFLPHFGVGIDPNPAQIDRLATSAAFDVPYFYRNRIHPEALKLISGPHLFVGGSGGYPISQWFEEKLGLQEPSLEEGNNVVNFSLSIAEKLGVNPIIFVGLDLCYGDRKSYAPGVIPFPLSERPLATKSIDEEVIVKSDIYGEPKLTLWKWINESLFITSFAKDHPHLKLINATEGGIGVPGTENWSLSQVKKKLLTKTFPLKKKISDLLKQNDMPKSVSLKAIIDAMQLFRSSLQEDKKDPAWKYLLRDFQSFYFRFIGKKEGDSLTKEEKSQLKNFLDKVKLSNDQLLQAALLIGDSMPPKASPQPVIPHLKGKVHGKVEIFYPDGKIFREIEFKKGKRSGKEIWYHPNGEKHFEIEYQDNIPIKEANQWDNKGNLRVKMIYDPKGKRLACKYYSPSGELLKTPTSSDFFQQAFSKTEKLQETLSHLVKKFAKVAESFKGREFSKDLQSITKELEQLTALEKKLLAEEESEPIWKTPLAKSMIADKISESYEVMGKEIKHMQELIKKLKKND